MGSTSAKCRTACCIVAIDTIHTMILEPLTLALTVKLMGTLAIAASPDLNGNCHLWIIFVWLSVCPSHISKYNSEKNIDLLFGKWAALFFKVAYLEILEQVKVYL